MTFPWKWNSPNAEVSNDTFWSLWMETSLILLLLFAFPKPESFVGLKWLLVLWIGCLWWVDQGGTDPDETTPAIAACENEQRSLLKLLSWGTGLEVKCGSFLLHCYALLLGKTTSFSGTSGTCGLKRSSWKWLWYLLDAFCQLEWLFWNLWFQTNNTVFFYTDLFRIEQWGVETENVRAYLWFTCCFKGSVFEAREPWHAK